MTKRYQVAGRELSARAQRIGYSQKKLQQDLAERGLDMKLGTLKNIMSGERAVDGRPLLVLAAALSLPREDPRLVALRLELASAPRASRTHLIRGLVAPIRVGYLEWEPFAGGDDGKPNGLVVELIELLAKLLETSVEWTPLSFGALIDDLELGRVDLAAGFVLQSARRMARSEWRSLRMPFSVGFNLVTRSKVLAQAPDTFEEKRSLVHELVKRSSNAHRLITIRDEIADEYLPGVLGDLPVAHREETLGIAATIREYTKDKKSIVAADHVSCQQAVAGSVAELFQVFDSPLGQYQGGFLFPRGDLEWANYFSDAYQNMLESRLPEFGRIVKKYAGEVADLISTSPSRASTPASPWSVLTLDEWRASYWPEEIPFPKELQVEGPERRPR